MRVWDAMQKALQDEVVRENIAARDMKRNRDAKDIILGNTGTMGWMSDGWEHTKAYWRKFQS